MAAPHNPRARVARAIDPTTGANVRRERELFQMPRAELARQMNAQGATHWSPDTVYRVEGGKQRLDVDEAAALIEVLGTDFLVGTSLGVALSLEPTVQED